MKNHLRLVAALCLSCLASAANTAIAPRTLEFASVGEHRLKLDLYHPATPPAGLIVWVHGGAWRGGSREGVEIKGLVGLGWALASVDYRLSTQARFPAQIHDIKAAIRFLRAHAEELGLPPDRFVIAGSSAGGHLAALAGVTDGVAELEGEVGLDRSRSSRVQAIVDLFGASNLTTILSQSTPHGLSMRVPALELLLGGQPDQVPALARLASPVFHLDAGDPPLLLLHGDQDLQMPPAQSAELAEAARRLGLKVEWVVVPGAGHGGPAFTSDAQLRQIDAFLRQSLGP